MSAASTPRRRQAAASELRRLPSVERLLELTLLSAEIRRYSRPLVTQVVQLVLASHRHRIGQGGSAPSQNDLIKEVKSRLAGDWPGFMSPVINASGIILHTNLGRAPLSPAALSAVAELGSGYINLESDLASGQRGQRNSELRQLLCALTGAEDALVVNNNASAVLLALVTLAHGREVIISRGELVQIGGGFRVPEIMEQSGVTLREVGTTNQTFASDYASALSQKMALVLKVHPSNFCQTGFVHQAGVAELAELAHRHKLPLVYDLGSGALMDTAEFGLAHEPTVQEALADGADLVCFSGDKLLGGPQSGIIVGRKRFVEPLLKHPLLRVVRLDKLSAIALEATLKHYLDKEAVAQLPVWQMIAAGVDELERRAQVLVARLAVGGIKAEVREGRSMVGGGSLPGESLLTRLVCLKPKSAVDGLARRLRLGQPPLIARVEEDSLLLDVRTVFPCQDDALVSLLKQAWAEK